MSTRIAKRISFILLAFFVLLAAMFVYANLLNKELNTTTTTTLEEVAEQGVKIVTNEVHSEVRVLQKLSQKISHGATHFELSDALVQLDGALDGHVYDTLGVVFRDGTAHTTTRETLDFSHVPHIYEGTFHSGEFSVTDYFPMNDSDSGTMVFTMPIYVDNNVVAALFANYPLSTFNNLLKISSFNGEGYTYIVKENGDRVIGSDHPTSFQNLTNIFDAIENSGDNTLACEQLRLGLATGQSGHIVFTNQIEKYIHYTPLGVNDWFLLSAVPVQVVSHSASNIMALTYFLCALVVALTALIVWFFSRASAIEQTTFDKIMYTDAMTGGPSYSKFVMDVGARLSRASSQKAFLMIDIENFSLVFEKYGRDKGDEVLRFIYHSIQETSRPGSMIARDTYYRFIMLTNFSSRDDLIRRANAFRDVLHTAPHTLIDGFLLKPSIGIYIIEDDDHDLTRMLNLAKIARDSLKGSLKSDKLCFYSFYDELYRDTIMHNKFLEDQIVIGQRNNEFVPYFQPKFNTQTKQVVGAEALARWIRPDGTIIGPGVFIPIAEESGLIANIDRSMFRSVCKLQRDMIDQGLEVVPVSVNLSRQTLHDTSFVQEYIQTLEKYNLPMDLVQLEITESTLFRNQKKFSHVIDMLHRSGFKLLIDDFGIGYSSLMMLKSMPVSTMKLDKSLIDDCNHEKGFKIVTSVISLAKSLDISVTAEGVETEEQYHFLQLMNCDDIQGYYFARPMPFDDYTKMLQPQSTTTVFSAISTATTAQH